MRCPTCGAEYHAHDRFCTHCGAPLSTAAGASAAQVANVRPSTGHPSSTSAGHPHGSIEPAAHHPAARTSTTAAQPGQRHGTLRAAELRLERLAGTQDLEGFSLRDMFGEVFKHRTEDELDDYLVCGTPQTTPALHEVKPAWPRPWLFGRMLLFIGALYAGLAFAAFNFQNINAVPGMLMMGALAVPLAVLTLFFELNVPRNVSLYTTLMLMTFGGVFAIIVALFGYQVKELNWLGASSAGIVEESGKLLVVALLMRQAKYKYILNGLLFGAAVGAGFAWFESGGYAFQQLLQSQSLAAAVNLTQTRALLSPFGHVAWTAIAAGALWRAKGDAPMTVKPFTDGGFWKAFLIPVVLHGLWDSPIPAVFDLKYIAIGIVGWFVVFGLVQQGLWQVRDEQRASSPAAEPAGIASAPAGS
ncbi:MAG TPA: PrsW family glutamic-type intramembrane protease [bacterium]|nr:PrsW family glutamic-type intramembrane protease [bacterium]